MIPTGSSSCLGSLQLGITGTDNFHISWRAKNTQNIFSSGPRVIMQWPRMLLLDSRTNIATAYHRAFRTASESQKLVYIIVWSSEIPEPVCPAYGLPSLLVDEVRMMGLMVINLVNSRFKIAWSLHSTEVAHRYIGDSVQSPPAPSLKERCSTTRTKS
jgi:hypothetical protein